MSETIESVFTVYEDDGIKILHPFALAYQTRRSNGLARLSLLFWLKLTHVFSLVVESPSTAVGEGGKSQTSRFQGEDQLMVQIVKHNRLKNNIIGVHMICLWSP